jgi:alkylhydroperoxidase family enzyme
MPDDLAFDDPRPPTEEEWGTPLVEPRSAPDVERKFRRRVGMVSGAVPYVVPHPWLYRPFLFLSDPKLAHLDEGFASAISFIVARDNSCRFCYSAFRTLLRLANFSPRDLEDLETHFAAQGFSRGEEWGLRLAVRLSRCEGVPEALDRLRALDYSAAAIREMAGISVLSLASNRIGTMLSIPVSAFEELADQWYLRPWRSVAVPLLRLSKTLRDGQDGLDETETGPLSRWVGPLRGTPVGAVLRAFVDQWLDERRPLSVRTKLLMLAVVARGVAAEDLEAHLRTRLDEQFGCAGDAFDTAIDHLSGAAVDDRVEPLLQLARSSIRYDFGPIKRQARECTRHLDRRGTLEAIASVSLANAVARLESLWGLDQIAS